MRQNRLVDGSFGGKLGHSAMSAQCPVCPMLLKKSENALLRFFRKEAQLNFLAH